MTNKATKYGLMTIAAVLLVAMAFAGAASAEDITISTPYDWQTLLAGKTVAGNVTLGNDIDLSEVTNPKITKLTGTFDGKNYTISNFKIDNGTDSWIGIIGLYSGTRIMDLTLSNFSVSGGACVGGLVGFATSSDNLFIENVHVEYGNVSGKGNVGGLIGITYSRNMTLNKSTAERMYLRSSGTDSAGGLVGGASNNASINDSWENKCEIVASGSSNVGGLVGYAKSASFVNASTKDSKISGGSSVGGLIGGASSANKFDVSAVENCTILGNYRVGGLLGKTDKESMFIGGVSWVNYTWVSGSTDVGSIIGYNNTGNLVSGNPMPMHTMVYNGTGSGFSTTWAVADNAFNGSETLDDALKAGVGSEVGHNLTAGKDYGYGSARYLTYDTNGATGTVPAKQVYAYGSTVTVPGKGDLEKAGMVFVGWTIGTPSGELLIPGQTFTITEDVTLYASWIVPPEKLTGSELSTYNVRVVDDVTGAVGTKHPSELNDDGAKDVYLLKNAEDWNKVAVYEAAFNGAVMILDADLDFSSTVDDYMVNYKFNGSIYGNGNVIKNFTNESNYDDVGLIRLAGDGLTLNYIQMNSSYLATSGTRIGTLIGKIPNTKCVIVGCSVYNGTVALTETGKANIGGLIGKIEGPSDKQILYSQIVNTRITSNGGNLGGVIGNAYYGVSTISNCNVVDCTLSASGGNVGGLIGYTEKNTSISDCTKIMNCMASNCTITVTGTNSNIGGLVGHVHGIPVKDSVSVNCSISGKQSVGGAFGGVYSSSVITNCSSINCSVSGDTYVGGVAGWVHSSSLTGCYALGNIIGVSDGAGGLAGSITVSQINNCIALNEQVSAPSGVGRIVGYNNSGFISNCYAWEGMLVNGVTVSGGALDNKDGLNVSSFDFWNKQSFFQNTLGWDFDNVWKMNDGNDKYRLPVLQWQTTPVSGDASYLIPSTSVTADTGSNSAIFGYNNVSTVRNATVSSIVLEHVNNVTGQVKFTADNITVSSVLPSISGMNDPITVSIFDITADNDGSGTNSTIYLNVTFSNLTDKDNVKFFHYTDGSGWDATPLTSCIVNVNADEKKVLYKVETNSFSPFGVGIFTPITYTVHFDANGGQGSMADMTFTYGEGQNLTANAFQRYNSNFLYWTYNGTKYYNTEFVNNLTTELETVVMTAQWETYSTGGSSSGSTYMGSNSASYTPTQQPTVKPTVAPTAAPTEKPATPTVIATEKPTTQATQQSPAPFVGLLAGLGATAVLLSNRRK